MDSMTLIAIASIVTAGLTIALGSIGPALGEGRAVATALTSLAQQPDAASTITRTLFVGLAMIESIAIYCFVVSMILHVRQSVLESRHRPDRRESSHAHRLVHRRRAGPQLPDPGVVAEALSLQADPQRRRRAGKADRRGTGGRRCEEGRGAKGARRVPAQERGLRSAARRSHGQGDGRSERRAPAPARRRAKSGRRLERQATRDAAQRRPTA